MGFRAPIESLLQDKHTSETTDKPENVGQSGFTAFQGLFGASGVFGGSNNNELGGSTDNRKSYGFVNYGNDVTQSSESQPLEAPPTTATGGFGFAGNPFGSFGFGSTFESDHNKERPERVSITPSPNVSNGYASDYEQPFRAGFGFGASGGVFGNSNQDDDNYSYNDEQVSGDGRNEYYDDYQYTQEESNDEETNAGTGFLNRFHHLGLNSFSDFGGGEKVTNGLETHDNDGHGKLDYPNGDITSAADNGVTAQSFATSTNAGFTKGTFGFGITQPPHNHVEEPSGFEGQNYQFNSNYGNEFDAFTGADLNGPTTVSSEGGSGFPAFSFKKREVPEPQPTRKRLNFYPIPNVTESHEEEQEVKSLVSQDRPAFATVIGNALPNFRDGLSV